MNLTKEHLMMLNAGPRPRVGKSPLLRLETLEYKLRSCYNPTVAVRMETRDLRNIALPNYWESHSGL